LLAAGGAVLVIALVAVALFAFDPPLLARLTRNLPGAAMPRICSPGADCPNSCMTQKPPTRCGSNCMLKNDGECEGIDLTYVQWNSQLALVNSYLERCNLRGSVLAGSLSGAHLQGATLADATLVGADLRYADLTGTDLSGADLTDAELTGATTSGTTWDGATFCRTTMPDGTVNNSGCP
jgi:uncharacterized protein YjbI with pentapeptide repeats